MRSFQFYAACLFIAGLLSVSSHAAVDETPSYTVFTYSGDPSTSLCVNWQTASQPDWPAVVHYSTSPNVGTSTGNDLQARGTTSQIEGLEDRFIHRVQLTELRPDTTYYLSIAGQGGQIPQNAHVFKIRTIPSDDSPLRFVTGGDMGVSEDVRTLLKHAAAQKPDFAVVGGDVAYANGRLGSVALWDKWLEYYTQEMVTTEGYSIPLVLAVGNHETNGSYGKTIKESPFFAGFFGQDPNKNHFSRRFGKNLALLILDSGHTATHESQAPWIREQLSAFKGVPYTAAVYHVPLYPSHRDFMEKYSDLGRQFWAPVFDEFELTVAFENHDHTHKRTHLLKDGKVSTDGTGTLYLGDGCWGRGGRSVVYDGRWYLKESGGVQHFWIVDVASSGMIYRAMDIDGKVFDVYPEDHPEAVAAAQVYEAKRFIYDLPSDCIQVTGYSVNDNKWSGGLFSIKVTNTFEYPLVYTIHVGRKAKNIAADGFTKEEHSLQPGATAEHQSSFSPASGKSLSADKVNLSFGVKARLMLPEKDPVILNANFSVPILNAEL